MPSTWAWWCLSSQHSFTRTTTGVAPAPLADPLHIGYYWKPRRLVFFCGLEDCQGTRGAGSIRKPTSVWAGKPGLSSPAPWVLGYPERAKRLRLVPPFDMFGLGPLPGSCCNNWQATWGALGLPGQAFADGPDGRLVAGLPGALGGAHKIFLRGRHQGHGTPIINCNPLGPADPFNTGCCAFCGDGVASCLRGNCSASAKVQPKCECAATGADGAAVLASVWKYLFTSQAPAGSVLPRDEQMHCCGGTYSGEFCCVDGEGLTGVKQCPKDGRR